MQLVAKEQGLAVAGACDKRVKTPLIAINDAQLEQEACVRVLRRSTGQRDELAVCRVALGQVKPTLLGGASVRTKNCLEGELFRSGQRMRVDVQRIVDAVELDR